MKNPLEKIDSRVRLIRQSFVVHVKISPESVALVGDWRVGMISGKAKAIQEELEPEKIEPEELLFVSAIPVLVPPVPIAPFSIVPVAVMLFPAVPTPAVPLPVIPAEAGI